MLWRCLRGWLLSWPSGLDIAWPATDSAALPAKVQIAYTRASAGIIRSGATSLRTERLTTASMSSCALLPGWVILDVAGAIALGSFVSIYFQFIMECTHQVQRPKSGQKYAGRVVPDFQIHQSLE